jgi:hypothetical protein
MHDINHADHVVDMQGSGWRAVSAQALAANAVHVVRADSACAILNMEQQTHETCDLLQAALLAAENCVLKSMFAL